MDYLIAESGKCEFMSLLLLSEVIEGMGNSNIVSGLNDLKT